MRADAVARFDFDRRSASLLRPARRTRRGCVRRRRAARRCGVRDLDRHGFPLRRCAPRRRFESLAAASICLPMRPAAPHGGCAAEARLRRHVAAVAALDRDQFGAAARGRQSRRIERSGALGS
ncbi:MAG TPA: hypothetical protein VGC30_05645 [Dokdonella sp.]